MSKFIIEKIKSEMEVYNILDFPKQIFLNSFDIEDFFRRAKEWILQISLNRDFILDHLITCKIILNNLPIGTEKHNFQEDLLDFGFEIFEDENICLDNKQELLKGILNRFPKRKKSKKLKKLKELHEISQMRYHLFDYREKMLKKRTNRNIQKLKRKADETRKQFPKEYKPQKLYADCFAFEGKNEEAIIEYYNGLPVIKLPI
jgi:hypothetical protein